MIPREESSGKLDKAIDRYRDDLNKSRHADREASQEQRSGQDTRRGGKETESGGPRRDERRG